MAQIFHRQIASPVEPQSVPLLVTTNTFQSSQVVMGEDYNLMMLRAYSLDNYARQYNLIHADAIEYNHLPWTCWPTNVVTYAVGTNFYNDAFSGLYLKVEQVKQDGDVWESHDAAVYITKVQDEDYQVEHAFFKSAEEDNTQWERWVAQDEGKREQREIARRQIENELQGRRERESARRAEEERRKQNEALANKRSLAILSHHLTDEQRQEYIIKRLFHFEAKSGRVYRLQEGTHGNVFAVENGKDVERFCIQPSDSRLPKPDVVLAQLLMLKTNEEEFRRIANISNLRDFRRPQELRVA